jgi:outer membrane lipoprotein SlyB
MPLRITLALLALCLVASCANPSTSGDVYSRSDTRKPYTTLFGTVTHVRDVKIEGEPSWLGTWGGYVVGYEIGRDVADSGVGGALGGIAGAVAGQVVEKSLTGEPGLEIQVELDNGDLITVVQSDRIRFEPGDAVRVLMRGNREARVQRQYQ